MSFTNDQKKILSGNGYRESSQNSDKYFKGNHSVTSVGSTTIFNTDSHTKNGKGVSNTTFGKKAW